MSEETVEKKGKYSFDLSDGVGKEDIFAIFAAIWGFIATILKIILWPYVWIFRIISRSIRFIRTKEATENPLSEDERQFMESIPTFFIFVGFFSGLLLAVLVWIFGTDVFEKMYSSITGLDDFILGVFTFFDIIIELIFTIIGIGYRPERWLGKQILFIKFEGTERSSGILDIVRTIFEFIWAFVQEDPLLLFISVGIGGVIVIVVLIILSETGVISAIGKIISGLINVIVTAPHKVYNILNGIFLRFNTIVSSIIIGSGRLENRNIAFHRKILVISYALGIYTFISGLFVLASQPELTSETTNAIIFIIIVLFAVGIGVGIIEMFIIVRFLDIVSRGKYSTAE
ncbi:MAG: hypothetical protein JSV04_15360 [Candidatus Heimdallarchaeota archaeon]|nr:MAG: hypothetical protein JSV04_15360 [Candidatus Heimdallarchaeota archaeon]